MKNFKLVLVAVLVLALCVIMASCGGKDTTTTQATVTQAPGTQATGTQATVTQATGTQATVTQATVTQATVTQATVTTTPATTAPVTPVGYTEADVPADGIISTANQLAAVLTFGDLAADYTLAADIDLTGITYAGLGGTVDVEDPVTGEVTTGYEGYAGTFDGANHTIKGVSSTMFLCLQGGIVKNVKIADSDLEAIFEAEDPALSFGCTETAAKTNVGFAYVVGFAYSEDNEHVSVISNVEVLDSCEFNVSIYNSRAAVSPICAMARGYVTIENCVNRAHVITDSLAIYEAGILGFGVGSTGTDCVVIKNCTNYGKIENAPENSQDSKVGGIVAALLDGTIEYCANYGEIYSGETNGQVAGIVGYVGNAVQIRYNVNGGKISGNLYIGGICGYSNGPADRQFLYNANYGLAEILEGSTNKTNAAICFARKEETFKYNFWTNNSISHTETLAALGSQAAINGTTPAITAEGNEGVATINDILTKFEGIAETQGIFAINEGVLGFAAE